MFALLLLSPAICFIAFQLAAWPDLETWLASRAHGFARADAFDGVTRISPLFGTCLGCTCLLASCFVVLGRPRFLLPLATGPLVASVIYLVDSGIADPNWFELLALLSIGMFVGSLATGIWSIFRNRAPVAHAKRCHQ